MTLVLLVLLGAIVFIVLSTSVLKVHPFLSLLIASLGVGLALGLPLGSLVKTVSEGFGGILAYIGLVIVLGSILGEMLEKSGGAVVIAHAIMAGIGKKRPLLALNLLGAIVGIPVFCDTGFIILSRLSDTIARSRGISRQKLAVGLAAGLYTSHTLIPPTPGPVAAAGNLGAGDYLGLVIIIGIGVSVPVIILTNLFLQELRILPVEEPLEDIGDFEAQVTMSLGRAVFPILFPLLLIGSGTLLKLVGGEGAAVTVMVFLGNPMVALLLSVVFSFQVLRIASLDSFGHFCNSAIKAAGPVLIITGAGGAFGAVLKSSDMAVYLQDTMGGFQGSGALLLFVGFLLAALLKTSQGSSTSAIVITSSMLSPILAVAGMQEPFSIALLVIAIGGGAMTVSHANDSYFWVVNQFGGLTVRNAYRSFTLVTLLQGLTTLVAVMLLYFLFNLV